LKEEGQYTHARLLDCWGKLIFRYLNQLKTKYNQLPLIIADTALSMKQVYQRRNAIQANSIMAFAN
jgi:hypothetical protein